MVWVAEGSAEAGAEGMRAIEISTKSAIGVIRRGGRLESRVMWLPPFVS
jgi:hypothetical protein